MDLEGGASFRLDVDLREWNQRIRFAGGIGLGALAVRIHRDLDDPTRDQVLVLLGRFRAQGVFGDRGPTDQEPVFVLESVAMGESPPIPRSPVVDKTKVPRSMRSSWKGSPKIPPEKRERPAVGLTALTL